MRVAGRRVLGVDGARHGSRRLAKEGAVQRQVRVSRGEDEELS
jgi:hypothetical protein